MTLRLQGPVTSFKTNALMKKMLRPRTALLLTSVILSLLFTSCTNKLTATFESDTIGSDPNKTLPGSPSGDAMSYVAEIENQLDVVATVSHPSEKSVEYKSVSPSGPISGHNAWLGFNAKSTDFAKPVTFLWTATKNFHSGGPALYIDCSDGSGVVAARLKIENNGDLILVEDILAGTGTNIGNIPNNESHSFLVTVDLSHAQYSISVLKSSGNLIKNGHSLLTSNVASYHNPAHPSVSFSFESFNLSEQYIIDEVFINRKN